MGFKSFKNLIYIIEEKRILRIEYSQKKGTYNAKTNISGDNHGIFENSFGIEIDLWVNKEVSTHSWNFIIFYGAMEISTHPFTNFHLYAALEFLVHNSLGYGSVSSILVDKDFYSKVLIPYLAQKPELVRMEEDIRIKASFSDSLKETERLEQYLNKHIYL